MEADTQQRMGSPCAVSMRNRLTCWERRLRNGRGWDVVGTDMVIGDCMYTDAPSMRLQRAG